MRHQKIYTLVLLALFSFGLQGDRQNNSTHYIQVLNHKSRPVVGEEWTVHFIANGKGELVIENHNPDEVEFVGLECKNVVVIGGKGMMTSRKVDGIKQEGAKVKVDWHYGMGKATFRPLKPGKHRIEFLFGDSEDSAFNQTTEVVSTESANVSNPPSIAVDSSNVYIVWGDALAGDHDILFKSKSIDGSWPATTEVVSTESTLDSGRPSIVVDSSNVYVAWFDITDYAGAGADADIFFKSKPIGGSWPVTTEVVSTESTNDSYLPSITVVAADVFIVWFDYTDYAGAGGDADVFFKRKAIAGSWPVTTEIVSTESIGQSERPSIAVDSGSVFIVWEDDSNYAGSGGDRDIFFKSKPIGASWPATTEVVSTESTCFSGRASIARDSSNLYVAWDDCTNYASAGSDADIFFKSKLIIGSWPATTEVVSTESTSDSYWPSISVDSSNVYVVWDDITDYAGAGSDKDIFFKSKPLSGSWPATTEIISTESTERSYLPDATADSNCVYVSWADMTDYDSSGADQDIFFKKRIPTPTPTTTVTPSVSATSTHTPTVTPTLTHSATPTNSPTSTNTPTASLTGTITHTPTISTTQTAQPTLTNTLTPTPTPVRDINRVIVYPNPAFGEQVTITNLPEDASIKIYTIVGELVRQIDSKEKAKVDWDLKTSSGKLVADGLYLIIVEDRNGKVWHGRCVVIRR